MVGESRLQVCFTYIVHIEAIIYDPSACVLRTQEICGQGDCMGPSAPNREYQDKLL